MTKLTVYQIKYKELIPLLFNFQLARIETTKHILHTMYDVYFKISRYIFVKTEQKRIPIKKKRHKK